MGDKVDRRSLGAAALALDAAELGTGGAASAPSGTSGPAAATITAGANTSLGALRHYR